MPDIFVQSPQSRQFLWVLHLFTPEVHILELIELGDVGWNILDPNCSRPDTPLVHQEQQRLRWSIPKPELWSQHVAGRLRYFRSGLVEKMFVASVERGSLTEHFLHHSIVCLY